MLRARKWQLGVCIALTLLSTSAMAQSNSESGQLKDKVIACLKSTAEGTCPEGLMNATLLEQCEEQLDRMKERLSSLGPIKEARYRGKEPLPNGIEAEVYRVVFSHGTMIWLAAAGPNGKLSALWSPG